MYKSKLLLTIHSDDYDEAQRRLNAILEESSHSEINSDLLNETENIPIRLHKLIVITNVI